MCPSKQITSIDYMMKEEKSEKKIELGWHAHKDRRGVLIFLFDTGATEF